MKAKLDTGAAFCLFDRLHGETLYFYEDLNSHGNFLGRSGWLDRVRMGLVHHDQQIYVEPYDELTH